MQSVCQLQTLIYLENLSTYGSFIGTLYLMNKGIGNKKDVEEKSQVTLLLPGIRYKG